MPINLIPRKESEGEARLYMGIPELNDIKTALWVSITQPPGTLAALMTTGRKAELRHRDVLGAPLFQAGAEESTGSLTQHVCLVPACGVELIDHNHAVGHSAYHMLYTPELIPTAESCPICLGPSADCPVYLLKTGSSALQPRVLCKVLTPAASRADPNTGVKFTHAGMSTSTVAMPSTNVPIVCPLCEPDLADPAHKPPGAPAVSPTKRKKTARPAVMKYNMRVHWAELHQSTAIPAGLEVALALAPQERALLGANKGGRQRKVSVAEAQRKAAGL